jgi:hypothetical protein
VTPAQARDLVPVLTAYSEGKVVQYRCGAQWHDFKGDDHDSDEPYLFGCHAVEWRIKPQPREWWFCPVCGSISVDKHVFHRTHVSHTVEEVVHVREVLP